ncbi:MAG: DUF2997 domain-containing protein [Lachnospiraceae bacterium]|nr:DUF2997 domain-containing protein [Lachnospiraceae bacterium]
MAKKCIQVKLKPDGSMEMETHGVKGKQCLKYMDIFAEMLRAQITDSAFTEEYYETETVENTQVVEELGAKA